MPSSSSRPFATIQKHHHGIMIHKSFPPTPTPSPSPYAYLEISMPYISKISMLNLKPSPIPSNFTPRTRRSPALRRRELQIYFYSSAYHISNTQLQWRGTHIWRRRCDSKL